VTRLDVLFAYLDSKLGRFAPSFLNCSDRTVRFSLDPTFQRAQASHFRPRSTFVALYSEFFD
jgi:hypothetical protein